MITENNERKRSEHNKRRQKITRWEERILIKKDDWGQKGDGLEVRQKKRIEQKGRERNKEKTVKVRKKERKKETNYLKRGECVSPPPSFTGLPAFVKKVFLSASAISYAPSTDVLYVHTFMIICICVSEDTRLVGNIKICTRKLINN